MNELFKYLIESSIIISVFFMIYLLIYNGDKNSQFNRVYLISSSFLAVLLPFLKIPILSTQQIEYTTSIHNAIQLPEIIINDNAIVILSQPQLTLSSIFAIVYLTGLAIFLNRFLFALYHTFKYVRTHSNDSIKSNNYTLVYTKGEMPTSSFYRYLFWDNTQVFNEKETNFIIKHEEGHIRQNHTFDIIYLEILRIIFWFNPIVHGYKKAMMTVHEFLADEFALASSNGQGFVAILGRQVLQQHHMTLSNHFSKSQTVKRIKMIKSGKKKPAVLRWAVMVTAVITMFYFFSCEQGYTINELIAQDENLPALGEGWSYISTESLSPGISEKFNSLKVDNPFIKFYVAKGITGKTADFNSKEILAKHSLVTLLFSTEGESMYVILGKIERSDLDLDEAVPYKNAEETIVEELVFDMPVEEEVAEDIFTIVEDQPAPIGGMRAFYEFVANNLRYPEEARNAGIEGKVFIEFVISKDGSVTNVKCIKGIGQGCDNEAIRVISISPVWKPGKHEGKNVNVRMILPITFKLGGS